MTTQTPTKKTPAKRTPAKKASPETRRAQIRALHRRVELEETPVFSPSEVELLLETLNNEKRMEDVGDIYIGYETTHQLHWDRSTLGRRLKSLELPQTKNPRVYLVTTEGYARISVELRDYDGWYWCAWKPEFIAFAAGRRRFARDKTISAEARAAIADAISADEACARAASAQASTSNARRRP